MLTEERRLAARHPWLYHVVRWSDESSRETIATDGLVPGHWRVRWHPLYTPRPRHVYLATHDYLNAPAWLRRWQSDGSDIYAVQTSYLSGQHINPDEDHFTDVEVCHRFRLQPPASHALWEAFKGLESYGEWAEQERLGTDSAQTAYSIRQGSLAYARPVPPMALLRWDAGTTTWLEPTEETP